MEETLKAFANTLRSLGHSEKEIETMIAPVYELYRELKADLARLTESSREDGDRCSFPTNGTSEAPFFGGKGDGFALTGLGNFRAYTKSLIVSRQAS